LLGKSIGSIGTYWLSSSAAAVLFYWWLSSSLGAALKDVNKMIENKLNISPTVSLYFFPVHLLCC